MFDFTNNTFNGILLFISTLLGLGYPLILGCIEKIDTKYHSTLLTQKFKNELTFQLFQIILPINILSAFVLPFILDGCLHSRWFILIQVILASFLIINALALFKMLTKYYDVVSLQKDIIRDFNDNREKGDFKNETLNFKQWTDLTPVLLESADEKLAMSIHDVIEDYYKKFYIKNGENKENKFPSYFYECITRINENLCKSDIRPFTINNSNFILTNLILNNLMISSISYNYLWKNLAIQIFYNREDWIVKYWEIAYNEYNYIDYRNSDKSIDIKKYKEKFYEFHIMLCAMLLQQKKYSTLNTILYYSNEKPACKYVLVPSTLSEIIRMLCLINEKYDNDLLYFNQSYAMPSKWGGSDDERIVASANMFLSLLVYRLYNINWMYGTSSIFNISNFKTNLKDISKLNNMSYILEFWIKRIHEEYECLTALGIKDFHSVLLDVQKNYKSENILAPLDLIHSIRDGLEESKHDVLKSQSFDNEIIHDITDSIYNNLQKHVEVISPLMKDDVNEKFKYNLCRPESFFYPNYAFIKDTDVDYVGIDDHVTSVIINEFYHLIASNFYLHINNKYQNIMSNDIFKLFKNLALDGKYIVVSFGIYWDYYKDRIEGFEIDKDNRYTYNGITILSLQCLTSVFTQTLYIMKKEDLPNITFDTPEEDFQSNYNLKPFEVDSHLWTSLHKVKDVKSLIPTDTLNSLGGDLDITSVFMVVWLPVMYIKDDIKSLYFKVKYKGIDEGNCIDVNTIKTFDEMTS